MVARAPPSHGMVLWTLCVICGLLVPGALGLVGEKKAKEISYLAKVDSFVFGGNGTFQFSAATSQDVHEVVMLIVDERELLSMRGVTQDICEQYPVPAPTTSTSHSGVTVLPINGTVKTQIMQRGRFTFVILNCGLKPVSIQVNYTAMNGESQLPYNTFNMVWIVMSAAVIWTLLLLMYVPMLLLNGSPFTFNTVGLQLWVVILVIVKTSSLVIAGLYWKLYESSGINWDLMLQLANVGSALFGLLTTYIILFLSTTWNPSRIQLPPIDIRKTMFLFSVSILGAFFLYRIGDNMIALCLTLICFFLLPVVINTLKFRVRQLQFYLLVVERLSVFGIHEDVLHAKNRAYRNIYYATVIYLIARFCIFVAQLVWVWYIDWRIAPIDEGVALLLGAVLLYYSIPKRSPIFSSDAEVNTISQLENWIGQNIQREIGSDSQTHEPWDMSSTIVIEWPSLAAGTSEQDDDRRVGRIRPLSIGLKEDRDNFSK